MTSEAAFFISAGDVSDGKNISELQTIKSYLDKELDIPYYVAIGDNDYIVDANGDRTEAAFEQVFSNTLQSFDYDNSHFVIFNSTDEANSFSEEELDWLESDLAQTDKDFIFLVMHVPIDIPMSESLFGEPSAGVRQQNDRFKDIVTTYGVDQIYTGHFHGYLNYELADIPVTVTGGAGSSPQFGFDEEYHYIQVSVYPEAFVNKYIPVDTLTQ